jgi:hypothetical protein
MLINKSQLSLLKTEGELSLTPMQPELESVLLVIKFHPEPAGRKYYFNRRCLTPRILSAAQGRGHGVGPHPDPTFNCSRPSGLLNDFPRV